MISTRQKKIFFIISVALYALYSVFLLTSQSSGILNMALFVLVVITGFYLAEDYGKYKSKRDERRMGWITLILALIISVLGILIHEPIAEAKAIIIGSIGRGLILGGVFLILRNLTD